jgi:hypothetical protein
MPVKLDIKLQETGEVAALGVLGALGLAGDLQPEVALC